MYMLYMLSCYLCLFFTPLFFLSQFLLKMCLCLFSFSLSAAPLPSASPRLHSPQSMNVDQYIHTRSLGALQAARQILFCQSVFIRMLNMSERKRLATSERELFV